MPTEKFTGVYRFIGWEWGNGKAKGSMRLFFQSYEDAAEMLSLLVWYDNNYRPYRGAGPSFRTQVQINEILQITVGVSKTKNLVLMSAHVIEEM